MITNSLMFNKDTLNIFTDASIKKMSDGETIGCAGSFLVSGPCVSYPYVLEQDTRIVRGSTSNNSEIHAVKLGIEKALKYRANGYKVINLISDSRICIFGLREWIFNWVRDSRGKDNLIGSSGQDVANQDVILQIVYMILDNELSINFYHQNGHIRIHNAADMKEAKKTFIASNFLTQDVDMELIKNISIANDAIDVLTGQVLDNNIFPKLYPRPMMRYIYMPFDVVKYAELINKRR